MNDDIPLRFGFPNTLPPLGRKELWSCFVFAGMGLFVLLIGLFPNLRPHPRAALPLALCWLALPLWGVFRSRTRKPLTELEKRKKRQMGTTTQVGMFVIITLGIGAAYFFWARSLGVAMPVILGSLFIIEGLGGLIVSLTEWWRLSHLGVSMGLVASGFLLPFVDKTSVAVPVGGAFLAGSLLSAGILLWQLHEQDSHPESQSA